VGRRLARSWAWREISQPVRVERFGLLGSRLAQECLELGPELSLGDDCLPPLVAFALEQELSEAHGKRQRSTDHCGMRDEDSPKATNRPDRASAALMFPVEASSVRIIGCLRRGGLRVGSICVIAPTGMNLLDDLRPKLEPFCRKHRLRHLAVFGSFSRGTQGAHSDIDLLATLEDPATVPADELFEMAGEAEELLGQPVDFVLRDRLEASPNRLACEHILATAVTIYGD